MKRTIKIFYVLTVLALALLLLAGCALDSPPQSNLPADVPDESELPDETETPDHIETISEVTQTEYILNTSSKKYHKPTCYHVKRISEANYQEHVGTAQALQESGYTACATCH